MIEIPKTNFRKSFEEPMPAWGKDKQGKLFIRCECGKCMGLDNHTVSDDGTVNPSLHHDEPDCGWHVWGKLLDWSK